MPKRYSLALPSTNPNPRSTTTALEPSAATLCTCTSVTTGTICSATLVPLVSPTRRTTPLTAFNGTLTWACVPAALTVVGRTTTSPRLPVESMVWNTTSRLVSKLVPLSVIAWPGLAEACAASAGLPLPALAPMLPRLRPKAALVPPTVLTRIGPLGAPSGTVTLSWPL